MAELIKAMTKSPPVFDCAGKLMSTSPFIHSQRINDSYELIYVIKGTLQIRIGEKELAVPPDSLVVVPPMTEITGTNPAEIMAFYWCHFWLDGQAWQLSRKQMAQYSQQVVENNEALKPNVFVLPLLYKPTNPARMIILFQQVIDAGLPKFFARGMVTGLLTALLSEITFQAVNSLISEALKEKSKRFNEISEWIHINAFRKVTASDVARRFNYNPNYISAIFRKKTGRTLVQYITQTKIEIAKEMLVTKDMTVKEIAYRLAFNDERYFMRCFKRVEGLTPTQYRNANAGISMNTRWLERLMRE